MNTTSSEEQLNEYQRSLLYDYLEHKALGFNSFFDKLYIKSAEHKGVGVFAKKDISKGEVVEYCPSIILGWRSKYHHDTKLLRYVFSDDSCSCQHCKKHGNLLMLPLGYGGIYNSADSKENANIKYHLYQGSKVIIFVADKDINKDQEILYWRGQEYYDNYCKFRINDEKDTFLAPNWKKEALDEGFSFKLIDETK